MAMKACKECGQRVSTQAEFCPHCGVKNPARRAQVGCGTGCLGLLAILVVFGVIGSLSETTTPSSTTLTPSPTSSRNRVSYVRSAVNVREGPGTDNAVAFTLRPGDRVYVGRPMPNGWAPVHSGPAVQDTAGWILRSLVSSGEPPDLLVLSTEWQSSTRYEPAFIVGEIRNLSGRNLGYVSITCVLFDRQDRQIGSSLDNMNNLRSGDTWRFKAAVLEAGAAKYRCDAPEGF